MNYESKIETLNVLEQTDEERRCRGGGDAEKMCPKMRRTPNKLRMTRQLAPPGLGTKLPLNAEPLREKQRRRPKGSDGQLPSDPAPNSRRRPQSDSSH